mgnify:CR=1 FL=1
MYLNINKIEDKSELEIFEENLIEILDDVFKKKKIDKSKLLYSY